MEIEQKTKLEEVAFGIAEVTRELMEDSIHWQLGDFPQAGDEYRDIYEHVFQRAIELMYEETTKK